MSGADPWAEAFAARHRLRIRYETPLPGRVPAYKYDDEHGPVVVLDSALPPERQHFSLAHETAHVLLDHGDEIAPEEELAANRLAGELLLPDPLFSEHTHLTLRELKAEFPHASFEVIARRRLAFAPGVLTIVDDMRLTRRLVADDFAAPPRPVPAEWRLIERCFRERADLDDSGEGIRLHGTYVDEGRGVIRVLLVTEEA